ncbi:MAG: hypothetical protein KDB94_13585, partial [Acidobacteria bacterium]|nr:hypothetical protein [Acidobacteriota bacterium]
MGGRDRGLRHLGRLDGGLEPLAARSPRPPVARGRRRHRDCRPDRRPGRIDLEAGSRRQGLEHDPPRPRRHPRSHGRHDLRGAHAPAAPPPGRFPGDALTLGLSLLGATGSIGRSALEVVRHHPDRLRVATLAAQGRKPEELAALARETGARMVAVIDPRAADTVRRALPSDVVVASGPQALVDAATHPEVDRVVAAIVGAAGLPPVHAALAAGKGVALANKESMVVAGPLLRALAAATGAEIVPVDSEHSALHQALRGGRAAEVRRLLLTASGGPFLRRDGAT